MRKIFIVTVLLLINIMVLVIIIINFVKMYNHLHDKLLVARQTKTQDAKIHCCSKVVSVWYKAELPDYDDGDGDGDGGDDDDGGDDEYGGDDGEQLSGDGGGGHENDDPYDDDGCPCLI